MNNVEINFSTFFLKLNLLSTIFTICEMMTLVKYQHAEEGKNHSLIFKWKSKEKYKDFRISVENENHAALSLCSKSTFNTCRDLAPDEFKTTYYFDSNTNENTIQVNIFNTSRDAETEWYIVQDTVVDTLEVTVFSRGHLISCNQSISNKGLYIWCLASKVYPKAQCILEMFSLRSSKLLMKSPMECYNKKQSNRPTYFNSNCSVTIPLLSLNPSQYNLHIALYPNVTGNETDVQFGTLSKSVINLENPTLRLRHCEEFIAADTEVTCICERSDNSLIDVSIGWFENSSHADLSNGSNVLKFKLTRSREPNSFYCKATNDFGWINSTVLYSPAVIEKLNNLSCSQHELEKIFSVSCTTLRTFPAALCQFSINFNNTDPLTFYNITHNNSQISVDPAYFKSTCALSLQKHNLEPGIYYILVTMYPNVTGSSRDLQFGADQLLLFNITPEIHMFSHPVKVSMIAYIIVANIGVIAIAFILPCVKVKGNPNINNCIVCKEKKDNDYDDINDGYVLAVNTLYVGNELVEVDGYRKFATNHRENIRNEGLVVHSNDYDIIED